VSAAEQLPYGMGTRVGVTTVALCDLSEDLPGAEVDRAAVGSNDRIRSSTA